jgi:hypothetical protein
MATSTDVCGVDYDAPAAGELVLGVRWVAGPYFQSADQINRAGTVGRGVAENAEGGFAFLNSSGSF